MRHRLLLSVDEMLDKKDRDNINTPVEDSTEGLSNDQLDRLGINTSIDTEEVTYSVEALHNIYSGLIIPTDGYSLTLGTDYRREVEDMKNRITILEEEIRRLKENG